MNYLQYEKDTSRNNNWQRLEFDEHVNNLCKKAYQKLNALVLLAPFMNVDKKIIILKAFIEPQFGYYSLLWMFHSRSLGNKINRITKEDWELHTMTSYHPSKICLRRITLSQYTIKMINYSNWNMQILPRAFPTSYEWKFCEKKQQLRFARK